MEQEQTSNSGDNKSTIPEKIPLAEHNQDLLMGTHFMTMIVACVYVAGCLFTNRDPIFGLFLFYLAWTSYLKDGV